MNKSISALVVICILFSLCNTPKKLANKAFHNALIGQNEMTIYSRIGMPTSTAKTFNGGKILMYEFFSMERFPTVNNFKPEDYDRGISFTSKSGAFYEIPFKPEFKNRKNMTYQEKVTSLMVFLDRHGKCIRFEHNLPKERLEFYYERLKAYIPED